MAGPHREPVITRLRVAALVALAVAGLVALVFAPGQVGMCLGPLGVTQVQCARATGYVPGIGPGLPILAAVATLTLLVVAPPPRIGLAFGAAALLGAAAGTAAYAALRPRTMDGPTSSGEWISIPRPFDPAACATAAILVAAVVALTWGHILEPTLRRRRTDRA